jgi:DNA-binding CsgD family transcriptional regulator
MCVRSRCALKLAGNHEAWALQDQCLPRAVAAVIECWSVAAQREGILAVHGSPHNPLMGRLSDERYVREALGRLPGWLCAHGHTHQAALWMARSDGTIERQRRPPSQRLGRSMRAVACPGALSGPDPSWLLVDTVRRRLSWHRIDAAGPVSGDTYPSSEANVHVSVGHQGRADLARQPTPTPESTGQLAELTSRELQVLELIARGQSNREIAGTLVIEESTVKTHVKRILLKLDLRDRIQAVIFAYETGLAQTGPRAVA